MSGAIAGFAIKIYEEPPFYHVQRRIIRYGESEAGVERVLLIAGTTNKPQRGTKHGNHHEHRG
jgi:hypothetical protein